MNDAVAQRQAQPGELCTCGRKAEIVFLTELHGQVGFCGVHNAPQLMPCVFCGSTFEHIPGRCPDYQLKPLRLL